MKILAILLCLIATSAVAQVSNQQALSQVGATHVRMPEEITAGVTPTNYGYLPGNVLRYGTNTTPGTTDMTAALNAAFKISNSTIPPGTYKFTTTLIMGSATVAGIAGNYAISGGGQYNTFLVYGGASTTPDLIQVQGTATNQILGPGQISGFSVRSTTVMTAGACLHMKWTGHTTIQNVNCGYQYQGATNLWNGFYFDASDFQRLEGFEAVAKNDAISVSGGGAGNPGPQYDLHVLNGKVSGSGIGIHIGGGWDGANFDRMMVTNNNVNVRIDHTLSNFGNQEMVFGSDFYTDQALTGDDYYIDDTFATNTRYCQIVISGPVTHSNTAHGIHVKAWPNCWVNVTGPYVIAHAGSGIFIEDASTHVLVSSATNISGNSRYGIESGFATSNVMSLGTFSNNTLGSVNSNVSVLGSILGPVSITPATGVGLTVNGLSNQQAVVVNGANAANGQGMVIQGNFTGAGTTGLLTLADQNNTSGVNLAFFGNGGTTPNKYVRVSGGHFQIINSAYSGNALDIADSGLLTNYGGVLLPVSTVAALPACNAGAKGELYAVSDATAPTYNAALTGGGAVSIPVYCNGTAWTAH